MSTLIKDGLIIDGSGKPGFTGSLLFEDRKIAAVMRDGEQLPAADVVIDAPAGLWHPVLSICIPMLTGCCRLSSTRKSSNVWWCKA